MVDTQGIPDGGLPASAVFHSYDTIGWMSDGEADAGADVNTPPTRIAEATVASAFIDRFMELVSSLWR
ncbi:hypothetical protein GCM10027280_59240 [Micromonospora polyrhachis]